MIKGKTESGFEYKIEEEALDDYELLEDLAALDGGEVGKVFAVADRFMGKEQHVALKEHIRGKNGRVSAKKMLNEITEIMKSNQTGKNS